jgi:hypothetical protein
MENGIISRSVRTGIRAEKVVLAKNIRDFQQNASYFIKNSFYAGSLKSQKALQINGRIGAIQ